jgi:hypothetical protein
MFRLPKDITTQAIPAHQFGLQTSHPFRSGHELNRSALRHHHLFNRQAAFL